jgi:hypothetical protein
MMERNNLIEKSEEEKRERKMAALLKLRQSRIDQSKDRFNDEI